MDPATLAELGAVPVEGGQKPTPQADNPEAGSDALSSIPLSDDVVPEFTSTEADPNEQPMTAAAGAAMAAPGVPPAPDPSIATDVAAVMAGPHNPMPPLQRTDGKPPAPTGPTPADLAELGAVPTAHADDLGAKPYTPEEAAKDPHFDPVGHATKLKDTPYALDFAAKVKVLRDQGKGVDESIWERTKGALKAGGHAGVSLIDIPYSTLYAVGTGTYVTGLGVKLLDAEGKMKEANARGDKEEADKWQREYTALGHEINRIGTESAAKWETSGNRMKDMITGATDAVGLTGKDAQNALEQKRLENQVKAANLRRWEERMAASPNDRRIRDIVKGLRTQATMESVDKMDTDENAKLTDARNHIISQMAAADSQKETMEGKGTISQLTGQATADQLKDQGQHFNAPDPYTKARDAVTEFVGLRSPDEAPSTPVEVGAPDAGLLAFPLVLGGANKAIGALGATRAGGAVINAASKVGDVAARAPSWLLGGGIRVGTNPIVKGGIGMAVGHSFGHELFGGLASKFVPTGALKQFGKDLMEKTPDTLGGSIADWTAGRLKNVFVNATEGAVGMAPLLPFSDHPEQDIASGAVFGVGLGAGKGERDQARNMNAARQVVAEGLRTLAQDPATSEQTSAAIGGNDAALQNIGMWQGILQRLDPRMRVRVLSEADYAAHPAIAQALAEGKTGADQSRGFFDEGNNQVILNAKTLTERNAAHEGGHALFDGAISDLIPDVLKTRVADQVQRALFGADTGGGGLGMTPMLQSLADRYGAALGRKFDLTNKADRDYLAREFTADSAAALAGDSTKLAKLFSGGQLGERGAEYFKDLLRSVFPSLGAAKLEFGMKDIPAVSQAIRTSMYKLGEMARDKSRQVDPNAEKPETPEEAAAHEKSEAARPKGTTKDEQVRSDAIKALVAMGDKRADAAAKVDQAMAQKPYTDPGPLVLDIQQGKSTAGTGRTTPGQTSTMTPTAPNPYPAGHPNNPVRMPGGPRVQVPAKVSYNDNSGGTDTQYRVLEASDIEADPANERPQPGTPAATQLQQRNAQAVQNFDPTKVINTSPSPSNGPPIVYAIVGPDGKPTGKYRIAGGHQRVEIIKGARDKYTEALKGQAEAYDPDATAEKLAGMSEPLLVREINAPETEKDRADIVRRLNDTETAGQDSVSNAVSAGRLLSDQALNSIATTASNPVGTPRANLLQADTRELAAELVKRGIIRPQEMERMIGPDGKLTGDGVDLALAATVAHVIGDAATIRDLQRKAPSLLGKLETILPQILRAKANGVDIGPVGEAARLEVERGSQSVADFQAQPPVVGPTPTREAMRIQQMLAELSGQGLREAFDKLIGITAPNEAGQGSMFGENRRSIGDITDQELGQILGGERVTHDLTPRISTPAAEPSPLSSTDAALENFGRRNPPAAAPASPLEPAVPAEAPPAAPQEAPRQIQTLTPRAPAAEPVEPETFQNRQVEPSGALSTPPKRTTELPPVAPAANPERSGGSGADVPARSGRTESPLAGTGEPGRSRTPSVDVADVRSRMAAARAGFDESSIKVKKSKNDRGPEDMEARRQRRIAEARDVLEAAPLLEALEQHARDNGIDPNEPKVGFLPRAEDPKTLEHQRDQLVAGRRMAMLYTPGEKELDVPAGMARLETSNGVYHYDPKKILGAKVLDLDRREMQNQLLNLGPQNKAEVAAALRQGRPMAAVVERDPNGVEVRAAAVTRDQAQSTLETMERQMTPGHKMSIEEPGDALRSRPAFLPASTEESPLADRRADTDQGERYKGLTARTLSTRNPETGTPSIQKKYAGKFVDPKDPLHKLILEHNGIDDEMMGQLNDAVKAGQAVMIGYGHAQAGGEVTAAGRAKEQKASSARQRLMDASTAQPGDKVVVPQSFDIGKDGSLNLNTFDFDKFNQNATHLLEFAQEHMPEVADKLPFKSIDDRGYQEASQDYAQNHAHGYKGDGSAPLRPTADVPTGFDPSYTPRKLDKTVADFLNAAYGDTSAMSETSAAGAQARELSKANEGYPNTPEPLPDVNPLRARINAMVDADGRPLFRVTREDGTVDEGYSKVMENVNSRLKAGLVDNIVPASEATRDTGIRQVGEATSPFAEGPLPKGRFAAAGFLPKAEGEGEKPKRLSKYVTEDEALRAASTQRGVPESTMMDATMAMQRAGAPAFLTHLLEHIGDLSHRAQAYNAIRNVAEKIRHVEQTHSSHRMSIEQEMDHGYQQNATYRVIQEHPDLKAAYDAREEGLWQKVEKEYKPEIEAKIAEAKKVVEQQLKEYVQAHEEHNEPITKLGQMGKDAAIALGKQDFNKLRSIVGDMRLWLNKYGKANEANQHKMYLERATEPPTARFLPSRFDDNLRQEESPLADNERTDAYGTRSRDVTRPGQQGATLRFGEPTQPEGRQAVEELVADWDQSAQLSPDGRSIDTVVDPRNREGKAKASARDFAQWVADKQAGANFLPAAESPMSDAEDGFYSQLSRVLEAKMPRSATAAQVRGIIDPAKGSGVKAEELKWSGIEDYLAQAGDKIDKADLLKHIKEQAPEFGESRYSEIDQAEKPAWTEEQILERQKLLADNYPEMKPTRFEAGDDLDSEWLRQNDPNNWRPTNADITMRLIELERAHDEGQRPDSPAPTREDAFHDLEREHLDNQDEQLNPMASPPKGAPKFSQYVSPGGTNYREKVRTVKSREEAANKRLGELLDKSEDVEKLPEDHPDRIALRDQIRAARDDWRAAGREKKDVEFASSHFGDAGDYVYHTRVSDAQDADGQPGTLIHEIQSDRHQKARKEGYKGDDPAEKYTVVKTDKGWEPVSPHGEHYPAEKTEAEALEAAANMQIGYDRHRHRDKIPDAPFRKDWALQGFKDNLKDAVAAGHKWIGWDDGQTNADRYSLANQVETIEWRKSTRTGDPGTRGVVIVPKGGAAKVNLRVGPDGVVVSTDRNMAGQADPVGRGLDDVIGKEVAERIMAEDKGELSGEGLKIGGKGMIDFYDKILPAEIGKYVKKWGVKPELVDSGTGGLPWEVRADGASSKYFATEEEAHAWADEISGSDAGVAVLKRHDADDPNAANRKRWTVPITPEMAASVKQGQPRFLPAGDTSAPKFKKWFEGSKVTDKDGAPLTVYHGTWEDFQDFKAGGAAEGIWFTDHPDYTENYGSRRIAAHLSMKNPLDLTTLQDDTPKRLLRKLAAHGLDVSKVKLDESLTMDNAENKVHEFYTQGDGRYVVPVFALFGKNDYWRDTGNLVQEIQRQGFDGVIMPPEFKDHDEKGPADRTYVVFDNNQVRITGEEDKRTPLPPGPLSEYKKGHHSEDQPRDESGQFTSPLAD